eukprot:1522-Heterococcus_DN1.PRE.1
MSSRSSDNASGSAQSSSSMMDVIEQLAAHMLADAIPSRASDDVEAAAIKNAANRCRQIANSNLGSKSSKSQLEITDSIKKKLTARGKKGAEEAARFQDLSRQLQSLKAMRNTAAMLHVLHDLAATSDVAVAQQQQSKLALTQQPHVFVPPSCDMNDFETQKHQASNNSSEHTVPGRQAALEALSLANSNSNISGLQPELEGWLLRDVLYAMQGIDGHYVRYDQQTETFKVDPSLQISPAVRDIVLRMCEMGWLFQQVNAYVEVTAHSNANDIGLVRAAFAASIQEELTDYYRLLAVMEAQLGCDINPMQ